MHRTCISALSICNAASYFGILKMGFAQMLYWGGRGYASVDASTWPIGMGCTSQLPWVIVSGAQVARLGHPAVGACIYKMHISTLSICNAAQYFRTLIVGFAWMPCQGARGLPPQLPQLDTSAWDSRSDCLGLQSLVHRVYDLVIWCTPSLYAWDAHPSPPHL